MHDRHAATIDRFDPTRGFGTVRLADGRVLGFDASVAYARPAELAPGASVMVELGQSRRTGETAIVGLWFAGRAPAPAPAEEPQTATPEQTLAALRAAGLASGIDAARFRDACLAEWRAEQARWRGDDDEPDAVEAFGQATLLAALSSVYGSHGPTDTGVAEGIFFIDEHAERDPEIRTIVQDLLERWLGRPLPAQETAELESMLEYAGDALYLRSHAEPGAALLFAADGQRETDDLVFTAYVLPRDEHALSAVRLGFAPRISPDTEAAGKGIFRVDGCRPAFADHAPACAECQANLAAMARTNRLPQDFVALLVP